MSLTGKIEMKNSIQDYPTFIRLNKNLVDLPIIKFKHKTDAKQIKSGASMPNSKY